MKYTVLKVIDITRNEAGKTRYNVEYFVNYLVFLYISCYSISRKFGIHFGRCKKV